MTQRDTRVLYDRPDGTSTLFLGWLSSVKAAEKGLRSAAEEARRVGGTNLRIEMRNRAGKVVYAAKVPEA